MQRGRTRAAPPSGRGPELTLELRVDGLAHGGEGVGRHNGLAVFVPGGVPGDLLKVTAHSQGRFARGRLLQVLEPSPQRVASDCALHPACGGCPWIEVGSQAQLQAKEQILRDALTRIGKLSLDDVDFRPAVPSPRQVRYRHRARLHVERHGDGRVLGFLPAKGRGVIPVHACQVLEAPLERALTSVSAALRTVPQEPSEVTLSCEPEELGGRVGVCIELRGRGDARVWRPVVERLQRAGVHAVEVVANGKTIARSNDLRLRYAVAPDVPGGPYFHDAACFTQGNREQNKNMIRLVLEALQLTGKESVLELHSGCGNFSLPVARAAGRTVALESYPRSVSHARENAQRARLGDKLRLHVADADRLKNLLSAVEGPVDRLLLDPPRGGAPVLPEAVKALRPARVVYVSCNPATLARDLAGAVGHGYHLESVQVLDLFPRTWHVETVAVLRRRA
ncbi:MAG: TRAM domain-containing protein [Myxococcota bacterium]